jgi:NAD(P)H dehydrogenase (quinone)
VLLITGASGQLGRHVVQQLLTRVAPDQIAGLVRDEGRAADLRARGVTLRLGDYDDAEALARAMQGVTRVLLIAGTDEERRVEQHQRVIDAAKAAGVQRVAYTSRTLKDPRTLANTLMRGHFQTEAALQASGLTVAIFRNVLYMDALVQFVGERVFDTGITLPAGQGRVSFALRSELGEAIANALLQDEWTQPISHLTGLAAYSFGDVAAELTRLSGRAVAYRPADAATFSAQLRERGVPERVAQRMVGFMTDVGAGQEDEVSPDLARLLGRSPTPLREGLKMLFQL